MLTMGRPKPALFLLLLMLSLAFFSQSFHPQAQGETNPPFVRIDPAQTESLDVGDNFTIYVWVDNAVGVAGAQVQFTYDLTVLNATQVVEGPFLRSFGPTITAQQGIEAVNDFVGEVYYSSAIISGATATGSGILLNVTFTVISEGSVQFHLIPFSSSSGYPGTYFLNIEFTNIVPSLQDAFYGSPISLTAKPSIIYSGDTTTLSGKLSGPSAVNVTSVNLMYSIQGGSWKDLGTIQTNSSGYFSREWTASGSGVFEFQVTFTISGKTTNSTVFDVMVLQTAGQGSGIYVLYACVGIAIFLVAVAIIMRVRNRRKQLDEPTPVP